MSGKALPKFVPKKWNKYRCRTGLWYEPSTDTLYRIMSYHLTKKQLEVRAILPRQLKDLDLHLVDGWWLRSRLKQKTPAFRKEVEIKVHAYEKRDFTILRT